MKLPLFRSQQRITRTALATFAASCVLALKVSSAHASIAYGSINNFDTVNDHGTLNTLSRKRPASCNQITAATLR